MQLEPGKAYLYHAPTQLPIDPPYKEACFLKKNDLLAKPELRPMTSATASGDCLSSSAAENEAMSGEHQDQNSADLSDKLETVTI